MSSLDWLRISNWLILISALIQASTGLPQLFTVPRILVFIHMLNAPIFVTLVVVHLMFNWRWMQKQMFSIRNHQVKPREALKKAM